MEQETGIAGFYDQVKAVKTPGFRIAWMMVFVAIAALDFGAIRALLGIESRMANALLLGVLPMVNVLAGSILVGQRNPGSRPFLLGFVAFGAMALALCVVLSLIRDAKVLEAYVTLSSEPWEIVIRHAPRFNTTPGLAFFIAVWVGWPQVTFALIGGFLSRRVSRRPDRTPN
jgi:hypothetical protein